ncbi:MAG TPA: cobyric acid synthase CobQ, partial [Ramlibacter sp.]|nr:cobyric acid synthase CobQ [Ramlibacter sp.]
AQGLDRAIAGHAQHGGRVLGICGGLQMLGEALVDPQDIAGNAPGLGLLPLVTQFAESKTVCRTRVAFEPLAAPWDALSGLRVEGYEIHQGVTVQHAGMAPGRIALAGGLGWQDASGRVLGVYLHGLFEDPTVLHALFGAAAPTLDTVFDRLADTAAAHFATGVLPALIAC